MSRPSAGTGVGGGGREVPTGTGALLPPPRVLPPHPSRELAGRGRGGSTPSNPQTNPQTPCPQKRGRNPTLGPCCFLPILLQRCPPPSPWGLGGLKFGEDGGDLHPFLRSFSAVSNLPLSPPWCLFSTTFFFPPLCFDFLSVQEDIKNKPRHGPSLGVLFAHGLLIGFLFGRVWALSGFPA